MSQPPGGSDRGPATGTPRWVKVFGIIVLVLVLAFVILMLVGGGGHGPGRHALPGDLDGPPPPVERGGQRP